MVIARALVDEGSDTSLASVAFIRKLGFSGRKRTLRIRGAADERQYELGQQNLEILKRTNKRHNITVWTLPKLCEAVNPVDWKALQKRYTHLADLDLETQKTGPIDLLLGMDQSDLLAPDAIRRGRVGEPFAIHTELGWIARGLVYRDQTAISQHIHFLVVEETPLDIQFRRFWETE